MTMKLWSKLAVVGLVVSFGWQPSMASAQATAERVCTAWEEFGAIVDGALDDTVQAMLLRGNDLFVGGNFLGAGDDPKANYVARWDGEKWHSLGEELDGPVFAFASDGDNLYVGGRFTKAGKLEVNGIAKWDGTRWHALGKGVDGTVRAIAVKEGIVYVGGTFKSAGGVSNTLNIAVWDGQRWSPLGQGVEGTVLAIAVGDSDVYVGGSFKKAVGAPESTAAIARWDGKEWQPLGRGLKGYELEGNFKIPPSVRSIVVAEDNVFVGGTFSQAGDVKGTATIALWTGGQWRALGRGIERGNVFSMVRFGKDLYVAGGFKGASGVRGTEGIARWDGRRWHSVAPNVPAQQDSACEPRRNESFCSESTVLSIAVGDKKVYLGGRFTNLANNPKADYVAVWDGKTWGALGESRKGAVDGYIHTIAVKDNEVYVGGLFKYGGGLKEGSSVIRWDGERWQPLGKGVDGIVQSVVISDTDVYIAGRFGSVGGVKGTNGVARWNGKAWQALGGGAYALGARVLVQGRSGILYAAGYFPGDALVEWDGRSWRSFSVGSAVVPQSRIRALLPIDQETMYIAGDEQDFMIEASVDSPSGGPAFGSDTVSIGAGFVVRMNRSSFTVSFDNALVNWEDISWRGDSYGTRVARDLATDGTYVYAAASQGDEHRILRVGLREDRFSEISPALDNPAYTLAVDTAKRLYVGGAFTKMGDDTSLKHIAVWDGKKWLPVGNGLNGRVTAMTIAGDLLFIGGEFTNAGGNPGADRLAVCRLK